MNDMTAKVSCFARAFHYRMNEVRIFSDDAAYHLLGDDYDLIAQNMKQGTGYFLPGFTGSPEEGLRLIADRQLSPSVLGRSAFCEKLLERSVEEGCAQYVILAAGYDTFGIRNRNKKLSVYELDLPDILADKEARIEKAGMQSSSVYVPCDLADPSWKNTLQDKGFDPSGQSFASLLGISYYLSKEEFRTLLRTLAGLLSEESVICFDYPSYDDSKETAVNRDLAQEAGEKMKAKYSEAEMRGLLKQCWFEVMEYLDHDDMTEQYFKAYNKAVHEHRIEAPKGVNYVLAVRKELYEFVCDRCSDQGAARKEPYDTAAAGRKAGCQ